VYEFVRRLEGEARRRSASEADDIAAKPAAAKKRRGDDGRQGRRGSRRLLDRGHQRDGGRAGFSKRSRPRDWSSICWSDASRHFSGWPIVTVSLADALDLAFELVAGDAGRDPRRRAA